MDIAIFFCILRFVAASLLKLNRRVRDVENLKQKFVGSKCLVASKLIALTGENMNEPR